MPLSLQPQPTQKQSSGFGPSPFAGGVGGGGRHAVLQHHESRKTMNKKISPVVATVMLAAAAALLLAAVASLPLRSIHRPAAANAAIFLCLAAYSVFLARSNGRSQRALFAPFFMLSAVLAVAGSVAGFAVPAAAGLSWVRSGILLPGINDATPLRRSAHLPGRSGSGLAAAAGGTLRLGARHMDVRPHPGAVFRGSRR